MLGKLIKYDFKSVFKPLLIIHGFVIIIALIGRLLLLPIVYSSLPPLTIYLLFYLVMILFFLSIIGSYYATFIIVANRFYKNLFSNESYLSRTLPVTSSMQLLSKTIVGSIWTIINLIMILGGFIIVFFIPPVIDQLPPFQDILSVLGYVTTKSFVFDIFIFLLTMLLVCIYNIVLIYLAVTLGQLISNVHKVLASIAMYFALSTVSSIAQYAIVLPIIFRVDVHMDTMLYFKDLMDPILFFNIIFTLVAICIMYLLTRFFIKHKVNL